MSLAEKIKSKDYFPTDFQSLPAKAFMIYHRAEQSVKAIYSPRTLRNLTGFVVLSLIFRFNISTPSEKAMAK